MSIMPESIAGHASSPGHTFQDVVIRRRNAVDLLRNQLIDRHGKDRYNDPSDQRVVFGSTLVDVAPNMTLLHETAELVMLIMEHTHWQVRLLSKSPLLAKLVDLIPQKYWGRLILGFSTGTLDDAVARTIEVGTGLVSKRIEALHSLQDRGIRTFAMICPSLPQTDYVAFSKSLCEALRIDQCEHVWAEVLNVRGSALPNTIGSLRHAGLLDEANLLEKAFATDDAWEDYARQTFEAHTLHVPPAKLRFLQYPDRKHLGWWAQQRQRGAFLLGKHAKDAGLTTVITSAEGA
ncbi:hypothetical protein [Novosphingobium sp.]|uniref:hypothetical protein n=1 Tax=Novosphingobium sp. TaxID=1874826 RepID=UPI00260A3B06|nr:hypothetical protein [Novosphingobium sp.]